MVDLATVNLVLDVILKPVAIAVLIGLALLLRDLDRVVKSIERSAESIETTATTLDEVVSVARKIPFLGPKRRKNIDVE